MEMFSVENECDESTCLGDSVCVQFFENDKHNITENSIIWLNIYGEFCQREVVRIPSSDFQVIPII